ncbi:MAG TPA: serine protease [Streptosporangiaceae bacterium]
MALVAGCGSGGSSSAAGAGAAGATPTASASGAAVGYWTRDRLLAAQPSRNWKLPSSPPATPGATPSGHAPVIPAPRVGALFSRSASGDHFCTASVVDSPGRDLLITAAHCIYGSKSGYNQDIVFIPDYQDGAEPYGVWTPSKLQVDPHWVSSSDPDYDVGFAVLKPNDGKNIQDVLGANQIGFNAGYSHLVRVTGYPSTADAPVTCINWTAEHSATQLKFDCGGYFDGTSGSPWLTNFDLQTRTGTIVGVIGGYQQGGDTPSISYSVYLNDSIRTLYQQAEALG